jgi:hypothetical protein
MVGETRKTRRMSVRRAETSLIFELVWFYEIIPLTSLPANLMLSVVIVKENMTVISDDMILHKNQLKNEKNF